MVGACQQNSGIFLVRGGGLEQDAGGGRGRDWDEIPARAEAGTGTKYRRPNHRAGSGLGAARDRTRYRRGPRPGLGQDAGGGRG